MRCDDVTEQLSAFLDGQLTAAETEAVRSHVAECARCRKELDALQLTVRAVAGLPRVKAPADLREKVLANLGRAVPVAQEGVSRWRVYWGAAAALVIATVIMLLNMPAHRHDTTVAKATPPVEMPAPFVGNGMTSPNVDKDKATLVAKGASGVPSRGMAGRSSDGDRARTLKATTTAMKEMGGDGSVCTFGAARQIVFPSENPQAAFQVARDVAMTGAWLPADERASQAELRNQSIEDAKVEEARRKQPLLELTLTVRQSELPLLMKSLASANLVPAPGICSAPNASPNDALSIYYEMIYRHFAKATRAEDEAAWSAPLGKPPVGPRSVEGAVPTAPVPAHIAPPAPSMEKTPPALADSSRGAGTFAPVARSEFKSEAELQKRSDDAFVRVTLLFPQAKTAAQAPTPATTAPAAH